MIGLYVHVSSEPQTKNYSLPVQKKKGIDFANSISEPYTIYQDAESGEYFTSKRDDLNRLFSDIKKKLIQKVWIIDQDRITRSIEDSQTIKNHFLKYNVKLYIDGSYVDLTDRNSLLFYNLKAVISEDERARIVERINRGKMESINSGRQVFPRVFGYDDKYDANGKKEYYINQDEASTVKLIYKLFMEGDSFRKIVKTLIQRSLPMKKSNKWTVQQVCRVLERPVYSGYVYNKEKDFIKSQIYEPIISLKQYQTTRQYWHTVKRINNPAIQFKHCNHQTSSIIRCCC